MKKTDSKFILHEILREIELQTSTQYNNSLLLEYIFTNLTWSLNVFFFFWWGIGCVVLLLPSSLSLSLSISAENWSSEITDLNKCRYPYYILLQPGVSKILLLPRQFIILFNLCYLTTMLHSPNFLFDDFLTIEHPPPKKK